MRVRAISGAVAVALALGAGTACNSGSSDDADPRLAAASADRPTASEPATSVESTTTTTRPLTLSERMQLLVDGVADRKVAVQVVDTEGSVVIDHDAGVPLIPASTAKLVTAAAALGEFGPDHRFRTRVSSTAFVIDGVIAGDLVVIGSGDPTLTGGLHGAAMPDRPRTPIEGLADQIAASGARHITGRLLADASVFPHEPIAAGADVGGDSSTLSSGLTVNAGRRVWVDGPRGIQSVVSDNPTQETVNVLLEALATRGVVVDGGAAIAEAPIAAPVPLAEMVSPPMVDLLRYMVQTSDNHIADAIFRAMGAKHRDGSWAGSARVVSAAMQRLGLPTSEFTVADGSGLSRLNRMTARGLIELDEMMAASRFVGQWYSLHAVTGSSGTLRNRLVDTVANGRVGGKTGTLRDVRAFTGFVTDGSQPRFRIAILGNGLDRAGIDAVVGVQDQLTLLLAERAATCEGQPDCPVV